MSDPTRRGPLGRTVHLDDARLVFVGQIEGESNTYCIGFRDEREAATRLVLSAEAFDALVWLRHNWDKAPLKEGFPSPKHETKPTAWRLVLEEDGGPKPETTPTSRRLVLEEDSGP